MIDDGTWQLLEDVIEAVAHEEMASAADAFSIRRLGGEPEIEVAFDGHAAVYRITVSRTTCPADA